MMKRKALYNRILVILLSVIAILTVGGVFAIYRFGLLGKIWNPELRKMVTEVTNDFSQSEYTDDKTGITLTYNLHVPKNYNSNRKYPLVLFIHDLSSCGTNKTATLTQGYGAVIWATKEEQTKHECFVLAPQYKKQIANDNYEITPEGEETIGLLQSVLKQYSIDTNRLYITGQSMGCMTAMYLNIKHPHLFAASLYVAGQWDAKQMHVLADDNIFYIVSEGDDKASPGMAQFDEVLKEAGVKASKAIWDGKWSDTDYDAAVQELLREGNAINLVRFKRGTILPNGAKSTSMMEHLYTWDVAYKIEGIRNWLFAQTMR
jgi:predicted peptidase